jgi:hypothetical protein
MLQRKKLESDPEGSQSRVFNRSFSSLVTYSSWGERFSKSQKKESEALLTVLIKIMENSIR